MALGHDRHYTMEKMKLICACLARMGKRKFIANGHVMHLKGHAWPTCVKLIGPIGRAYSLDAGTFSKTSSLNRACISQDLWAHWKWLSTYRMCPDFVSCKPLIRPKYGTLWYPLDTWKSVRCKNDRSLLGRTRTRNDGELAVKVRKSHFGDDENGDATLYCLRGAGER